MERLGPRPAREPRTVTRLAELEAFVCEQPRGTHRDPTELAWNGYLLTVT